MLCHHFTAGRIAGKDYSPADIVFVEPDMPHFPLIIGQP
jgi:hypothetical protein